MPIFVQPILRARQEALEKDGLIGAAGSGGLTALNSTEVTMFLIQEATTQRFKVVPKGQVYSRNTVYTPI